MIVRFLYRSCPRRFPGGVFMAMVVVFVVVAAGGSGETRAEQRGSWRCEGGGWRRGSGEGG